MPDAQHTMPRLSWVDALVVVSLVASAAIIAHPVLDGGLEYYIDNPVHLAETLELAKPSYSGWSELGFCGLPLSTLHSPFWYWLLGAAVRAGVPVLPLYAGFLFMGFVAPCIAVFGVARRRVGPMAAGALAYIVLIQSPAIVGIGASIAGMWTHSLAAALTIVFGDLIARRTLTRARLLLCASLLGLIGLTHLFAIVATVLLVAVAFVVQKLPLRQWRPRAIAFGVAALVSAQYWLTFLMVTDRSSAPLDALTPVQLGARLLLPTNVLYLLDHRLGDAIENDLYFADAVPMVGLVALGCFGFARGRKSADELPRIGFWFACLVLVGLLVHRFLTIPLFGPVSWRFLFWVRLGLALSAIPVIGSVDRWLARPGSKIAVCALASALGFVWATPLRNAPPVPTEKERADLEALWRWLEENADRRWARLYVQDTFGQNWEAGGLSQSHGMVLTALHTGLPQLGTYYGVVPFRTRWTLSEFKSLFGSRTLTAEGLRVSMDKTNSGAIVASNEWTRKYLSRADFLEKRYERGRFSVWVRKNFDSEWVAKLRPTNRLGNVKFAPGDIAFDLTTDRPRGRVVAKVSWHPWWRLAGIPNAKLVESPDGFLGIDTIPKGSFHVRLWFEPNPLPAASSRVGALVLFGWALGLFWFERRQRAAPTRRLAPAKVPARSSATFEE